MLTSTAPIRPTANCVTTHSGAFIDQMPTCSPRATPCAISADATRVDPPVELAPRPAQPERREDHGVAVREPRGRAAAGRSRRSDRPTQGIGVRRRLSLAWRALRSRDGSSCCRAAQRGGRFSRKARMPSSASSETRTGGGDGRGAAEVVRPAARLVEQSLGRLRRASGPDATKLLAQRDRLVQARLGRHHPVDQSPAFGLGRGDRLAGQQQGPGAALADLADQVVHDDRRRPAPGGPRDSRSGAAPAAITKSQAVASPAPPAKASPLSAAIVGLGRWWTWSIRSAIAWTSSTASLLGLGRSRAGRTPPSGPSPRRRPGPRR